MEKKPAFPRIVFKDNKNCCDGWYQIRSHKNKDLSSCQTDLSVSNVVLIKATMCGQILTTDYLQLYLPVYMYIPEQNTEWTEDVSVRIIGSNFLTDLYPGN